MQRKQHATQSDLPEQVHGAAVLIAVQEPGSPGGMNDLCDALARIIARVCSEPDAVKSRQHPHP